MAKNKRTNKDLHNITQKTKARVTRTPFPNWDTIRSSGRIGVPVPHLAPLQWSNIVVICTIESCKKTISPSLCVSNRMTNVSMCDWTRWSNLVVICDVKSCKNHYASLCVSNIVGKVSKWSGVQFTTLYTSYSETPLQKPFCPSLFVFRIEWQRFRSSVELMVRCSVLQNYIRLIL
jgi:hypothetical protein